MPKNETEEADKEDKEDKEKKDIDENKKEEKKKIIENPKVVSYSVVVRPIPEPAKPVVLMNFTEKEEYIKELQIYIIELLGQILTLLHAR